MKILNIDKLQEYLFNRKEFTVEGISMNPTLSKGDVVGIEMADHLKAGDIIVYTYKNNILIHRIITISNNLFWCKGDNTWSYERINKECIIGRVKYIRKQKETIYID